MPARKPAHGEQFLIGVEPDQPEMTMNPKTEFQPETSIDSMLGERIAAALGTYASTSNAYPAAFNAAHDASIRSITAIDDFVKEPSNKELLAEVRAAWIALQRTSDVRHAAWVAKEKAKDDYLLSLRVAAHEACEAVANAGSSDLMAKCLRQLNAAQALSANPECF